jgi:hypothetical protein
MEFVAALTSNLQVDRITRFQTARFLAMMLATRGTGARLLSTALQKS